MPFQSFPSRLIGVSSESTCNLAWGGFGPFMFVDCRVGSFVRDGMSSFWGGLIPTLTMSHHQRNRCPYLLNSELL